MSRLTLRFLTLALFLTFAAPAQARFEEDWRVAYYFLTSAPTEEGCFIKSYFILNPFIGKGAIYQPRIVDLNIKGRFVFHTEDSVDERQGYPVSRGEHYSGTATFPVPCDEFRYFEITEAVCTIDWLGPGGSVEEMEVEELDLCLGEMPRQVGISGSFDPDDPNMLLPIAPQPPAQ